MRRSVCQAFLFSLVAGSRAPSHSEKADKQILRGTDEDNFLLQVTTEDNHLLQVKSADSEKAAEEDVLVEEAVDIDEAPQLCDEPLLVDVKQGASYTTVKDSLYNWGNAWNYSEAMIDGITENLFSKVDDLADEFDEVLFCPTLLDLIITHLEFQTSLGGEAGRFARHLALADARARQMQDQLDEEEDAEQAQVQTGLLQRASARGKQASAIDMDKTIKEKCCCNSPVKYGGKWKYHRYAHKEATQVGWILTCSAQNVEKYCPAEDDCPCKDDDYKKVSGEKFSWESGYSHSGKACLHKDILNERDECKCNCDAVHAFPRTSQGFNDGTTSTLAERQAMYNYGSEQASGTTCSLRRRASCPQFHSYWEAQKKGC